MRDEFGGQTSGTAKCASHVRTLGLLGTFNNDRTDELITADCQHTVSPQIGRITENEARNIYFQFGDKWRVDGQTHPLLFQVDKKALYNPPLFADPKYIPSFDPWRETNQTFWQSLIFSPNQVRVSY